jgi:hypothetical protein
MTQKNNSELLGIILGDYSSAEKQEAGQQLLTQSPSNSDLCYIIRYTELKQEAWQQLLTQSPSNSDLRYIIEAHGAEAGSLAAASYSIAFQLRPALHH